MKTKYIVAFGILLLAGGYFAFIRNSTNSTEVNSNATSTAEINGSMESGDPTAPATSSGTTTVKKPSTTVTTQVSVNYIRMGQKVLINGVFITPTKISYDSRCPKDVKCIQAGSLDLGVLFEKGSTSQNVIITSGKPFLFAGKTITLTSVTPSRISTKKIVENEYRFLFTVK